jgi:hypothetical protein
MVDGVYTENSRWVQLGQRFLSALLQTGRMEYFQLEGISTWKDNRRRNRTEYNIAPLVGRHESLRTGRR